MEQIDTEDMTVLDVYDHAVTIFEEKLENLQLVKATELNLDSRCGKVYIDVDNEIIVTKHGKTLEYFGGFEYIDDECTQQIGNYKIYFEHDRVIDAIVYYKEHNAT